MRIANEVEGKMSKKITPQIAQAITLFHREQNVVVAGDKGTDKRFCIRIAISSKKFVLYETSIMDCVADSTGF
jgi:hypothetical protein